MRTEELAGIYQSKSDDELLALAQSEGLTPEAEFVLRNEMARRGIRFETEVEISETRRCEPILESEVAGSMLRQAHSVTEFTGAVTRMYRGHFVLFFKLTVPAIAIGFIAFTIARREGGELLRQFFGESSSNRNLLLLKVRLIADAWQLIAGLASCASFAAICVAVGGINSGSRPGVAECFSAIGKRISSVFRLSLLFIVLVWLAIQLGMLAISGYYLFYDPWASAGSGFKQSQLRSCASDFFWLLDSRWRCPLSF